jgi:hypothetical protein
MDEKRKKDLEDVIKTESRRGRRPVDLEARRKRDELLNDMRKLLMIRNEEEFLNATRAAGLRDGSKEFEKVLRIWREFRP